MAITMKGNFFKVIIIYFSVECILMVNSGAKKKLILSSHVCLSLYEISSIFKIARDEINNKISSL